jgi:hypothetical protein
MNGGVSPNGSVTAPVARFGTEKHSIGKNPMDRIEIDGGIISSGPDKGQRIYFVSINENGAEMVLWDGPSYGRALLEGQLCSVGFQLPLVNETGIQADG